MSPGGAVRHGAGGQLAVAEIRKAGAATNQRADPVSHQPWFVAIGALAWWDSGSGPAAAPSRRSARTPSTPAQNLAGRSPWCGSGSSGPSSTPGHCQWPARRTPPARLDRRGEFHPFQAEPPNPPTGPTSSARCIRPSVTLPRCRGGGFGTGDAEALVAELREFLRYLRDCAAMDTNVETGLSMMASSAPQSNPPGSGPARSRWPIPSRPPSAQRLSTDPPGRSTGSLGRRARRAPWRRRDRRNRSDPKVFDSKGDHYRTDFGLRRVMPGAWVRRDCRTRVVAFES